MTAENGASVLTEERERDADWLTGLLPLLLISLIYYRLSAAVLELLAVGGYLMASALIARLDRRQPQRLSFARGAVGGLLLAFCLPAQAPFWLAALGGGVAGVLAVVPEWLGRRFPRVAAYTQVSPIAPACTPSSSSQRAICSSVPEKAASGVAEDRVSMPLHCAGRVYPLPARAGNTHRRSKKAASDGCTCV